MRRRKQQISKTSVSTCTLFSVVSIAIRRCQVFKGNVIIRGNEFKGGGSLWSDIFCHLSFGKRTKRDCCISKCSQVQKITHKVPCKISLHCFQMRICLWHAGDLPGNDKSQFVILTTPPTWVTSTPAGSGFCPLRMSSSCGLLFSYILPPFPSCCATTHPFALDVRTQCFHWGVSCAILWTSFFVLFVLELIVQSWVAWVD